MATSRRSTQRRILNAVEKTFPHLLSKPIMKQTNIFERLETLAKNLWWTWQPDAQQLFAAMDPPLWEATKHNPIRTIKLLSAERRNALVDDEGFAAHLVRVEKDLAKYLSAPKKKVGPRNMLVA